MGVFTFEIPSLKYLTQQYPKLSNVISSFHYNPLTHRMRVFTSIMLLVQYIIQQYPKLDYFFSSYFYTLLNNTPIYIIILFYMFL